ncbi:MAG: hypothetical protein KY469_18195 [Actinobacteria bacterium]|nr:hypothetical protein [Actinomycetota bacterium]
MSAAITALLLASAPAGALVHSASSSSASGASSTAAASAEPITASVASAAVTDSAVASTAVAAAEAVSADTVVADQSADSNAAADPIKDADQAGSTEVKTEARSCGAEHDTHYEPPSGQGLQECKDPETGEHDDSRTYTAKHFTNELTCGTQNEIPPMSTPLLTISGDGTGGAGGGGGYIQVCSDDELPVHGRITLAGDVSTGGSGQGSLTADGDNTNSPDQARGWAQVNFGSGGTPSVRCGKAYADGGRADSTNPTTEDNQEQCG